MYYFAPRTVAVSVQATEWFITRLALYDISKYIAYASFFMPSI